MDAVIPLDTYFNRLVLLQAALVEIASARDLAHHHIGNGAMVAGIILGMKNRPDDEVVAFKQTAQDIAKRAKRAATDTLTEILGMAADLDITNTNLITLTAAPEKMTADRFNAMAALNDKIKIEGPAIKSTLGQIRFGAEEALVKAAGFVPADFKLNPSG